METQAPEGNGGNGNGNGKPPRYSFLAELLETTRRNEKALDKVLERQEDTTAMILKLKEHRTVEKTDEVYTTMANVMFAGRVAVKVLAWGLGTIAAGLAITYTLHQLFGWF